MTLLTCGMMTSMFSVPRSAIATLSVPPDACPELVCPVLVWPVLAGLDAAAAAALVGAAAAGAAPLPGAVVAAAPWPVDGAGWPQATSNPATINRLEIHL